MKVLRRALAGLALLPGCSPLGLLDLTVPGGDLRADRDIAYGPLPRQRLDLYRPREAGAAPLPLLVFFYGGAWRSGAREGYRFVAEALASQGMLVAIPDYRLFPAGRFPGFLRDGAAAVAWLAGHAAEIGADPRAIFLAGHSAGAYIAAMLALDGRWLGEVGLDPARLAGVIGLAGPYDFAPIEGADVREVFAGARDERDTQPITFASAAAPPMLLLTGDADETVGPGNSRRLAARLRALGATAELREYPGVAHAGILLALAPLWRRRAPVITDMLGFIRARSPAVGGRQ